MRVKSRRSKREVVHAKSYGPRKWAGIAWVAPPVLWLLLFGIGPMIFLALMSFWTSTAFGISKEWSLQNYAAVALEPIYLLVLLKTLRIALVTTLLTLLISYPTAFFLCTLRDRTKALFILLIFLPFWTSYIVRSFVWLPILGRSGIINLLLMDLGLIEAPIDWFLYNEGTVYLGLVYVYTLFMTLPIYLSLDKMDPALTEAAGDLGASPLQTFRRIILPLSMPGVWSGSIMVFLLCCGAFVTPQLLGGPSGIMFGNVIAGQFLNANNWPLGATLSIVLVVVVLLCVLAAGRRFGLKQLFISGH